VQSLTAGVFQDRLIWPFVFDVVTDEEETHLYGALALASPAASGPQPPSVPISSLTKPRAASCIFASVGSESASSPCSGF
jgi:hypothetical protein